MFGWHDHSANGHNRLGSTGNVFCQGNPLYEVRLRQQHCAVLELVTEICQSPMSEWWKPFSTFT